MTQLHRTEANASRALTDRKRARDLRRRGRYDDMLDGDKDPSSAQRRHGRAIVAAEIANLDPRGDALNRCLAPAKRALTPSSDEVDYLRAFPLAPTRAT